MYIVIKRGEKESLELIACFAMNKKVFYVEKRIFMHIQLRFKFYVLKFRILQAPIKKES
jgi:hypothetical protein